MLVRALEDDEVVLALLLEADRHPEPAKPEPMIATFTRAAAVSMAGT
jgi:hypothetical protein